MGPTMLKMAARYADTWNSYGGEWGAPPDVILKNTQQRTEMLDKYCRQIGRDPKTLRRSLLIFGSELETVFDSEEAFQEVVNRYTKIGITEFIFFHPHTNKQIPIFKQIAKHLIPHLRARATSDKNWKPYKNLWVEFWTCPSKSRTAMKRLMTLCLRLKNQRKGKTYAVCRYRWYQAKELFGPRGLAKLPPTPWLVP